MEEFISSGDYLCKMSLSKSKIKLHCIPTQFFQEKRNKCHKHIKNMKKVKKNSALGVYTLRKASELMKDVDHV